MARSDCLEHNNTDPVLSLRITSCFSISKSKLNLHNSGQNLPSSKCLNRKQFKSVPSGTPISKDVLEKLVENRQTCILCPASANPVTFKTKGSLKFHLRIKHSKEIVTKEPMLEPNLKVPSEPTEKVNRLREISDDDWSLHLEYDDEDKAELNKIQPKPDEGNPYENTQ